MSELSHTLDGSRVLVVEDQYFLATEMRRLVQQLGGDVIGPAKDVESALGLLDRVPAPDLAILDVNLNGGRVDRLADTLRALGVPLLFATGYEAWALDSRFAGEPLVSKPVTAAPLAAAVMKIRRDRKGSSV